MRRQATVLFVLATLFVLPATPRRVSASPPDTTRLYGTWRWLETANGQSGLRATPEACGCERLLTLGRRGRYEFVEQDSAHEYVLCEGTLEVHPGSGPRLEDDGRADSWISLGGWWNEYERNLLVRFVGTGADTILTYPGGPLGLGVVDASTSRFARVASSSEMGSLGRHRTRLPLRHRPPGSQIERLRVPGERDSVYYEDEPVLVTGVPPAYPDSARAEGIQGEVILHVLLGKDGRVKNVNVIRGVTGLNEAAVDAVKRWIFKPATSAGKPVAVWIELPIHFPP